MVRTEFHVEREDGGRDVFCEVEGLLYEAENNKQVLFDVKKGQYTTRMILSWCDMIDRNGITRVINLSR